jgi:hypothetical protein
MSRRTIAREFGWRGAVTNSEAVTSARACTIRTGHGVRSTEPGPIRYLHWTHPLTISVLRDRETEPGPSRCLNGPVDVHLTGGMFTFRVDLG